MKNNEKKVNILGIAFGNETKNSILEKIKKNISSSGTFFHIVSINPENIITATEDSLFNKIVTAAQVRINDGIGTVFAAQILGFGHKERIPGVDLMHELIEEAQKMRLRVLLIGGEANLADGLAKCYSKTYSEATFWGIQGVIDIKKPNETEMNEIKSIVTTRKPHLVFVAFGSPMQEKWIWEHKDIFSHQVCMGVGGAFDYEYGLIERAPSFVRSAGFEWLFRLFKQPWRIGRQLKLPYFLALVFLQRLGLYNRGS